MMNKQRRFEKLVAAAQADGPPVVDVSEAVLARLADRPARGWDLPMAIAATTSAAAAIVVVVYALRAWSGFQDPVAETLFCMNLVLQ